MQRSLVKAGLAIQLLALLAACGGGGTTAPPPPPPPPPPPATAQSVAVSAGDNQTATPGTAVPVMPEVLVTSSDGKPLADAQVTFTVLSGGGTVSAASVNTDSAGHASSSWTLGAAAGLNALTATVGKLTPLTFSAVAAHQSKNITITVPVPNGVIPIGDSTPVFANVTSTYQLASVTASYGGRSVVMTYGPYPYSAHPPIGWNATLSLAGLPAGKGAVVITATDVMGNVTDLIQPDTLDRPPVIAFTAPMDKVVANPTISVAFSCIDDNVAFGCYQFQATAEDQVTHVRINLTSGTTVDLSQFAGHAVQLSATATDSASQRTTVNRTVYVESSSHLSSWAFVNGPVWDVLGSRILFLDISGTVPALKIFDKASGQTTTIDSSTEYSTTGGKGDGGLTSVGALFTRSGAALDTLYEWKGNTLTNLGTLDGRLAITGNWAVYSLLTDGASTGLLGRDLAAGTTVAVAPVSTGNVAANGDVVYSGSDANIYRVRGGVTTAITNDSRAMSYPDTDGVNVAYLKAGEAPTAGLYVSDGAHEILVSAGASSSFSMADGFVAYLQPDATQASQVWRYDPSSNEELTFYSVSSTIDAIGSQGDVMLRGPQRYLSVPGTELEQISSTQGTSIYRDGVFYVLIDQTVLLVKP